MCSSTVCQRPLPHPIRALPKPYPSPWSNPTFVGRTHVYLFGHSTHILGTTRLVQIVIFSLIHPKRLHRSYQPKTFVTLRCDRTSHNASHGFRLYKQRTYKAHCKTLFSVTRSNNFRSFLNSIQTTRVFSSSTSIICTCAIDRTRSIYYVLSGDSTEKKKLTSRRGAFNQRHCR